MTTPTRPISRLFLAPFLAAGLLVNPQPVSSSDGGNATHKEDDQQDHPAPPTKAQLDAQEKNVKLAIKKHQSMIDAIRKNTKLSEHALGYKTKTMKIVEEVYKRDKGEVYKKLKKEAIKRLGSENFCCTAGRTVLREVGEELKPEFQKVEADKKKNTLFVTDEAIKASNMEQYKKLQKANQAKMALQKRLVKISEEVKRLKNKEAVKAADDDESKRAENTKKDKVEQEETNKARREDRKGTSKPRSEEDRIVEADEGGMLIDKSLKLSDLDGCGSMMRVLVSPDDKLMGWVSTPCPGLSGGRVATQADFFAKCNSFEDFSGECRPPGPGTERALPLSGVYGMPFYFFCLDLHYKMLAAGPGQSHRATVQGDLESVFKYDNRSRKLECFYISKAQAKSLYLQDKKLKEGPAIAKPVAEARPKKECKSGRGIVGAMNCVTERIKGAGGPGAKTPDSASSTDRDTGITTTSVKNADGTRTVTRTGKDDKVLSKETLGKSPASASSTDKNTGITTTSVRNSDGTRTVIKTDKDDNVLSRKTVGNSPDSASSTDLKTKVTIKSVANPDGSRTVTTTNKDGIFLSREKVR